MKTTTMSDPVHLPLPEEWPDPRPGCEVCDALASERSKAAAQQDYSKVTDCNIELRAHKQPHHRRRRQ
ncbi:hypothetical protein [Streptomyces sp. NPDC046909]|uniref:hypothetical protein n=1 Tax=Streptomyces sp. NPDC046909 TaxID=3155617 RepID=UPI0033F44293